MQRKLTIMTSKHPSSLLAWLFVMLPILAFFSACSNHKAGDEQKAYALFLEAINHNAAGDKKLAITLIDSALQMNAADTTRSWLTCEKTTALVDLGKLKEATAIGKNGILFAGRPRLLALLLQEGIGNSHRESEHRIRDILEQLHLRALQRTKEIP